MTTASIDQMKRLNDDLGRRGADVDSRLTVFPSGCAMLDVRRDGRAFVMAYSPAAGFGVDEVGPDEGFGNHYRFAFADFESAADKLRGLTESLSPRWRRHWHCWLSRPKILKPLCNFTVCLVYTSCRSSMERGRCIMRPPWDLLCSRFIRAERPARDAGATRV